MAIFKNQRKERLKGMLLTIKLEVEANLRQELGRKRMEEQDLFASSVRDEGDLSHFGFEQEISRRRLNTCTEKLKRIMEAIEWLNDSTFGIYEECGGEISEKRLLVMPFAAYCLECQEALEDEELTEKIRAWTEGKNRPWDH